MKYLFELFLNGEFPKNLLEDYHKKEGNKGYLEFLEINPQQNSLEELLHWYFENEFIKDLQEEIQNMKREYLYNSFIHGINHNERVLFWVYYLSKKCELNETFLRIVLDGAKYHDIGRVNDQLDPSHGSRSASKIEHIVDNEIYQEKENLDLLKAIVELHSLHDNKVRQVMKKYNIQNKEQFYILFSILKDADALDRIRSTYLKNRFSALNPTYLRLDYSKKLLQATHELNEFYIKNKEKIGGELHEKYIH